MGLSVTLHVALASLPGNAGEDSPEGSLDGSADESESVSLAAYSGITDAPDTLASAGSFCRGARGMTQSRSGQAGASTPWYVS